MAQQVTDTIEHGEILVAEAGTGTGKTFSDVIPALLSGSKVIISTGTKNLQDQLFLRDLPKVKDVLNSPVKTALHKGRSNYLCIHRLENALQDQHGHQRIISRQLAQIRDWSITTRSGDIAELRSIPEDTMVWPLITSTGDNCLGNECPTWGQCHLLEARRNAQEADVVIINHHLLCADFAIKDEGFGELLPAVDAFIIDEAHQLPDVASNFFGSSFSSRQILELAKDTQLEYHKEAGDMPELIEQTDKLSKVARDLRLAFGDKARRGGWKETTGDAGIERAMTDFREELSGLSTLLDSMEGRGKGLDSCLSRTQELASLLDQMCIDTDDSEDIR